MGRRTDAGGTATAAAGWWRTDDRTAMWWATSHQAAAAWPQAGGATSHGGGRSVNHHHHRRAIITMHVRLFHTALLFFIPLFHTAVVVTASLVVVCLPASSDLPRVSAALLTPEPPRLIARQLAAQKAPCDPWRLRPRLRLHSNCRRLRCAPAFAPLSVKTAPSLMPSPSGSPASTRLTASRMSK